MPRESFIKAPFTASGSYLYAYSASFFTIISATFARQLLNLLNTQVNGQAAKFCFWVLTIPLLMFLFRKALRGNFATLVIGSAVVLFSLQLNLFEERIHLLQYGLVGLLWTRAYLSTKLEQSLILPGLLGLTASLATACIDEGVQALLPYRVADIRDIGFDALGCLAGVLIGIIHEILHRTYSRNSASCISLSDSHHSFSKRKPGSG